LRCSANLPMAVYRRLASAAKAAKAVKSRTCGRLYVDDTLLERLAQALEHMAPELRQLVHKEHTVVCPRHFAQHGGGARR
jgi:hypothetical protein